MIIAKFDPRHVLPRLVTVALAGILIFGNWAAAQTAPNNKAAADKQPIPSLEELLARTLAAHPEIVAARSKVQMAEAELKLTRFEVARQQIALWNNWSWATQVFEQADSVYRAGEGPAASAIEAQAKLAAVEAEIRQVLADSTEDSADKPASASRSPVRRVPRGPIAEKIRKALAQPTRFDFVEEPLFGVVDYFKKDVIEHMMIDHACRDIKITAPYDSIPLVAAIQLIEDLYPEVRFVVREYGIFVTTKGSPVDLESISAVDFWFETASESENVQPQR